jgi:hypothetical protein
MKPRQQAILHTVARWARVYVSEAPYDTCRLCEVAGPSCKGCPYIEVFGAVCTDHFPELYSPALAAASKRKEKLRRACELAAQYGLKRQAALIVRRILRG